MITKENFLPKMPRRVFVYRLAKFIMSSSISDESKAHDAWNDIAANFFRCDTCADD